MEFREEIRTICESETLHSRFIMAWGLNIILSRVYLIHATTGCWQHQQHLIQPRPTSFCLRLLLWDAPFGVYMVFITVIQVYQWSQTWDESDAEDLRGDGPLSLQQQCICVNMAWIEEFCELAAHIFGIRYAPF